MNKHLRRFTEWGKVVLLAGVWLLITGCVSTPKIDWTSRIGVYTYDQAVMDYGPPDKSVKLSDSSTVAEWVIERGRYHTAAVGVGGYHGPWYRGYGYRPYGFYSPAFYDPIYFPERHLRLIFGPDGKLKDWRPVSK